MPLQAYRLVFASVSCKLNKPKGSFVKVLNLPKVRVVQKRILLIAHVVSGLLVFGAL